MPAQYVEWIEAHNDLIDRLGDAIKVRRSEEAEQTVGFLGMTRDEGIEDDDRETLLKATASRLSGALWFARYAELCGKHDDLPELPGGNLPELASARGKLALCLNYPEHDFDMVSQQFASRGGLVADVQGWAREIAEGSRTVEQTLTELRDAALDAMEAGRTLTVRLGHTTPDFMLGWCDKAILPNDFWTAGHHQSGGKLAAELHPMVSSAGRGDPARFEVREGYHLILCTMLKSGQWRNLLRGKLPIGELQPIQLCPGLVQIQTAMQQYEETGGAQDDVDAALAAMDSLADML